MIDRSVVLDRVHPTLVPQGEPAKTVRTRRAASESPAASPLSVPPEADGTRRPTNWSPGSTNTPITRWACPRCLTAPTLDRIRALCGLLGDPERACPVIHLTGTNGKGSTARIVTELLMANGLTVGTYTSPNLATVNERLARDNEPISDHDLAGVLSSLSLLEPLLAERPTRFELPHRGRLLVVRRHRRRRRRGGGRPGGRWDATNVVEPDVAVVTNVSYDHVEVLGPSLTEIAAEKAGIVKPGCRWSWGRPRLVLLEVFLAAAERAPAAQTWVRGVDFACDASTVAVGGRLLDLRTPGATYPEVFLALHGRHQADNAAAALAASEAFFGAPCYVPRWSTPWGRCACCRVAPRSWAGLRSSCLTAPTMWQAPGPSPAPWRRSSRPPVRRLP